MDGGHLTFEEFLKLSEEDRGKRYVDLSEHDKFRVRCSMGVTSVWVPCNDCKHFLGFGRCKAYPDGITREHCEAVIANPYGVICEEKFKFESTTRP